MLKELHEIYNIRNIKKVSFSFSGGIRTSSIERKTTTHYKRNEFDPVIRLFSEKYPEISSYGWYVSNYISIIFSTKNDSGEECFIPIDFEVINEKSKDLIKSKNNKFIENNYGDNQSHYKGFEELLKIAKNLKNYETYSFLRNTAHQILSINPDIRKIFDNISSKENTAFHIMRVSNYAILYGRYNPIFYLKI